MTNDFRYFNNDKEKQEMNTKYCQCCAMPMGDGTELHGTNSDGSVNEDYCKYCFDKGDFTFKGTMEKMIEICVPHVLEANKNMNKESARKMMLEFFPTLKRWKE